MRMRTLVVAASLAFSVWSACYAFQISGRDLRAFMEEDGPIELPPDAAEKTEFTFARMRYQSMRRSYWGGNGSWATDWPKADRQFVQGVRRLTRINVRSVEEVVDMDTDKLFDFPFIYLTEPGTWSPTDAQVNKLREYLLRGGFIMTDDFHGTFEWEIFMAAISRVFPDRPVVDLEDKDAIFHVLYDLDERFQVPGIQMFFSGRPYERDGVEAKWRGIYDDKGRLMMAITHNSDVGDAWEWADHPQYPEKTASLAYRIGINYIIYSMTH